MKTIWIEYSGQDSDLCIECENNVTMIDEHTPRRFCGVQCQDNEDGACPEFKKIGGDACYKEEVTDDTVV